VDFEALTAVLASRVQATGLIETVNGELTHTPGQGLRAAVWLGPGEAVPARSGLAATSVRVDAKVRIYGPVFAVPVDEIDPTMLRALDAICGAYLDGFGMDGVGAEADPQGISGRRLSWEPGYLDVQAGTCRVVTLTLPVIVDDVWKQVR
jgi:hypothetical protein